jgi:hypothetical protein
MILFVLLTFPGGLEIADIRLQDLAAMTSSLKRTRRQLPARSEYKSPAEQNLTGIPFEIP